jgi:hypothetical protein
MAEFSQERGRIRYDANSLEGSSIRKLGHDCRIDVYADGLDRCPKEVPRSNGMKGGGDHEGQANPFQVVAHFVLGCHHIGDDIGEGAIVSDGSGQDERYAVPDARMHDALGQDALTHRLADASTGAYGVDGPHVVFVGIPGGGLSIE